MRYSKDELLKMHNHLIRGRLLYFKIKEACSQGLVGISFHSPYGQEGPSVAIMSAMKDTDWFVPSHRSQVSVMMRFSLKEYFSELFCRTTGINRGVSFDYHLNDENRRICVPLTILGQDYPVYTGFAWGLKQQGKKDVVVIEAGDGACSEGATYEAWNLAALYKAPCVYIINNNEWAMAVPSERETFNPNISEKAVPIGLPTQIVDGSDLLAVREAMEIALEKARNCEPNVIEIKQLRWGDHFIGARAFKRHDQEKLEDAMANKDAVKIYEKYLIDNNVADRETLDKVAVEAEKEMDEAIAWAKEQPFPEFDDVFGKDYIYATPETGGELE